MTTDSIHEAFVQDFDKTCDRIVDLALAFTARPTPQAFHALDEACDKLVADEEAEFRRQKALKQDLSEKVEP